MKQEQNSAKLKVYFRAMNLSFHRSEDDFNASMSFLSIYHLELAENFAYYACVFDPFYNRKENEMIPLQGFFHFLKLMKLSGSTQEVMSLFQALHEIEGVNMPVDDTLNIKNGFNYAQFLEAILRIAYLKAEGLQDEYNKAPGGIFKNTLENMFQNANIDVNKRIASDPVLIQVYNQDNNQIFFKH